MERVLEAVARERDEVEELERRLEDKRRRLAMIEALANAEPGSIDWDAVGLPNTVDPTPDLPALDAPEPEPEVPDEAALDAEPPESGEDRPATDAPPAPHGLPVVPADVPPPGPEPPGEGLRTRPAPIEERDNLVYEAIARMEPCSAGDLRYSTGLSPDALKGTIARLRSENRIQMTGSRGGARYWLTATLDAKIAAESGRNQSRMLPGIRHRVLDRLYVDGDVTEEGLADDLGEGRDDVAVVTGQLLADELVELLPDGRYHLLAHDTRATGPARAEAAA